MKYDFNGKSILSKFAAYVRKPVGVNDGGNKAMFYADSGNNANIVCQFSTNFFWGQTVNVVVYLVKDRDGVPKSNPDGTYPMIASFIARIEHPIHKNNDGGQTAVFYAEAGENGNEVSKFMYDEFVDALVYIELRGMLSIEYPELFEEQSQKEITETHQFNLSEQERRDYERNKKAFLALNIDFRETVLNRKEIVHFFEKMVENQQYMSYHDFIENVYLGDTFRERGVDSQCYASNCYTLLTKNDIYYANPDDPYSIRCLCPEHAGLLHSDNSAIEDRMIAKAYQNKKRWMWHWFVLEYSYDKKSEPDSKLLYKWLEQNNFLQFASKNFVKGLMKLK